jgi:hypothetical protein
MSKKYNIFISYRRQGGSEAALHLHYLLTEDGYTVSFDLDSLGEGKFAPELLSRIDNCTDFIIILNKDAFNRTMDSKCPKENDWLRIELGQAIKEKKHIIPIYLDGYEIPDKENLPEDIRAINEYHGLRHSTEYFDHFYKRVKSFLTSVPNKTKAQVIPSVKSAVITHHALETPKLIKEAKHHIYLHAAYYPKYADDSFYNESFQHVIRNNPNIDIRVIISDTDAPWAAEFGLILRNHFRNVEVFKESTKSSINFFRELGEAHPDNLKLVFSDALPLAPYLIIDNTILIGHYAHSRCKAPEGYWFEIQNDRLIEMCGHNLTSDTTYFDTLDEDSRAASRYLEDFQFAYIRGLYKMGFISDPDDYKDIW